MTKAEEAALKRFPEEMTRIPYQDLIEDLGGKEYIDLNSMPRGYFQLGYEQAEKDLALTWEDMQLIWQILDMMSEECKRSNPEWAYGSKSYFIEVLKRFKEAKK